MPPGQYVTKDFPVLSAGPTPRIALEQWTLTVGGLVDPPRSWTWEEFQSLPAEEVTVDIHCVTKWSKLDTTWRGVSLDALLADRKPEAAFALIHSYGGYTTNLADRRPDRRQGVGRIRLRWPAARLRARRPGAPARPPPLLLEERQMGDRHRARATPTGVASGSHTAITNTVTHGGNSATPATELATRRGGRPGGRDGQGEEHRASLPGMGGPPPRSTPRHPV